MNNSETVKLFGEGMTRLFNSVKELHSVHRDLKRNLAVHSIKYGSTRSIGHVIYLSFDVSCLPYLYEHFAREFYTLKAAGTFDLAAPTSFRELISEIEFKERDAFQMTVPEKYTRSCSVSFVTLLETIAQYPKSLLSSLFVVMHRTPEQDMYVGELKRVVEELEGLIDTINDRRVATYLEYLPKQGFPKKMKTLISQPGAIQQSEDDCWHALVNQHRFFFFFPHLTTFFFR